MNRRILFLASFVGLCALFASSSRGTEQVAETGKVLLLDNDQLIEGDIRRVGSEYVIRKGAVGETSLPATRVVKLVQSKAEAFQTLRARANLRDPDEHIRLARWGLVHQMYPEALREAEAALEQRPTDNQAKSLVAGLKKLIEKPIEVSRPEAKAVDVAEVEEVVLPSGLNPASYPTFATKIQPILMNVCSNCHATGKGGSFNLVRVFESSSNRKGTVANFAATVAQIDRKNPKMSPLLQKAVSAHGEPPRQPLRDTSVTAYKTLETWALAAYIAADEKIDFGSGAASKPIVIEPEKTGEEPSAPPKATKVRPPLIGETPPGKVEEKSEFSVLRKDVPPKKEKDKDDAPPKDEFDPAIFNKQPPKK